MSFKPLTLRQARLLAGQYQDLVGREFPDGAESAMVEAVTVVPYDDINRWIFLQYYSEGLSAAAALAQYPGYFYDVLVIGRTADGERCVYKDIAACIKTQGRTAFFGDQQV